MLPPGFAVVCTTEFEGYPWEILREFPAKFTLFYFTQLHPHLLTSKPWRYGMGEIDFISLSASPPVRHSIINTPQCKHYLLEKFLFACIAISNQKHKYLIIKQYKIALVCMWDHVCVCVAWYFPNV